MRKSNSPSRDLATPAGAVRPQVAHPERVHDFTWSRWGHALHGLTWREIEPRRVKRFLRKDRIFPRASVMVHCSPTPQIGDRVRLEMKRAGVIELPIVDIDYCTNPRDMFTLTLEYPEGRSEATITDDGCSSAQGEARSEGIAPK